MPYHNFLTASKFYDELQFIPFVSLSLVIAHSGWTQDNKLISAIAFLLISFIAQCISLSFDACKYCRTRIPPIAVNLNKNIFYYKMHIAVIVFL